MTMDLTLAAMMSAVQETVHLEHLEASEAKVLRRVRDSVAKMKKEEVHVAFPLSRTVLIGYYDFCLRANIVPVSGFQSLLVGAVAGGDVILPPIKTSKPKAKPARAAKTKPAKRGKTRTKSS